MRYRYYYAPARVHLQLDHGVASAVRHPDIDPVEGHADRVIANVEGALQDSVISQQLGHGIAS